MPKVLMAVGILVIIKREAMADIIAVVMLPKIEPNVLGVMTNDKLKSPKGSMCKNRDYHLNQPLFLASYVCKQAFQQRFINERRGKC